MTLLDLMAKEIEKANTPLTIREALDYAMKDGTLSMIETTGKTLQNTINSLLHKDIKRGENARFVQVSTKPAKFDIKDKRGL